MQIRVYGRSLRNGTEHIKRFKEKENGEKWGKRD